MVFFNILLSSAIKSILDLPQQAEIGEAEIENPVIGLVYANANTANIRDENTVIIHYIFLSLFADYEL